MTRLRAAPRRVSPAPSRLRPAATLSDQRITGRRLQDRRLRLWAAHPHCAACGALTRYPDGFELDHVVPLAAGGADTDDNCQVLCIACHEGKTRVDMAAIRGQGMPAPNSATPARFRYTLLAPDSATPPKFRYTPSGPAGRPSTG